MKTALTTSTSTAKPSSTPSPSSSTTSTKASGTTPAPPLFELGTKCLFVCDYGYYYQDAANAMMQCVHTDDKTKELGKWQVVKLTTSTTAVPATTTTTKAATTSITSDSGKWQVVGDALGQCKLRMFSYI